MAQAQQEQQLGFAEGAWLRSVKDFVLIWAKSVSLAGVHLYRLIYTSHASRLFGLNSLAAIAAVSRRNNMKTDVTGLLVYHDRRFFQVLEGEQLILTRLMTRLVADPRHMGLSMIDHGPVERRAFTTWRLCWACDEASRLHALGASALRDLIPVNSDLRGSDPQVRQHVRSFLAGLRDLSTAAAG